jgi:hypothetical protein
MGILRFLVSQPLRDEWNIGFDSLKVSHAPNFVNRFDAQRVKLRVSAGELDTLVQASPDHLGGRML